MIEKKRRKLKIGFYIFAIISGIIIGVVCALNNVPDPVFNRVLVAYVVIFVAIWVFIDFKYMKRMAEEVNALLPILYDEEDPRKYLEKLTELLGGAKSRALRTVFCINSAVAYCDMDDYETAKSQLHALDPQKLRARYRLIYELNDALISMHLGEVEKTMEIWNAGKEAFLAIGLSENFGPSVASLRIFAMIYEGREEDAKREIDVARARYPRPRNQKAFDFLEKLLENR